MRYYVVVMAIISFGDQLSSELWMTGKCRRFPSHVVGSMIRKLAAINAAVSIDDLRSPPGNHLKCLTGRLAGRWSIRVNDQWRVTFEWRNGQAHRVLIEDYH